MNKAILIAAGFVLATGPAYAQNSWRYDERDRYSDRDERGGREDRGDRDRGSSGRGMDEDARDRGQRAGARFMLRSGDVTIDVRCDPVEPTRTCVDATMSLMERVRSLPPATNPSAAPGSGTPAR